MGKIWAALVLCLGLAFAGGAQAQGQAQAREVPLSIVAFGDSLTQGYGLMDEEGFVPQLRAWLEAQGRGAVRVVNAGVSGDTSAGGLSRVEWTLTPDIHGMILALGGNDVLRGLDPKVTRANIEGILQVAQAAGVPVLLVGMQAPGNYGPEYQAAFEAIWPELAEAYGALYFESFFKGLGEGDLAAARAYFQADGIHPNPEGVGLIVDAMGPAVLELIAAAEARRAEKG
ncbi:MAG: arylesterase [Paracoccaceae bacterium]|nr:arylesterase [Paracoccaceae bacterium]